MTTDAIGKMEQFLGTLIMEKRTEQNIQLLTAKDAAKICRLSKRSWFRLSAAGRIPKAVKIGGSVRWKLSDVEQWLEMGCPIRKEFEARVEAKK